MAANILIVDDDLFVREVLSANCRTLGHRATLATNGAEAIKLLKENRPDLVITDVVMPEVDGVEVVKHIKTTPSLETIPVLVISGTANLKTTAKCIELGAEDVLQKPFETAILHARIKACLERNELRKQAALAKEIETRERFSHEIVGTICHNFNQPLTAAMGNLQLLDNMIALLHRHCEFVHGHMNEELGKRLESLSCEFFVSNGRNNSRPCLFQGIIECQKALRESTLKISSLVKEVSELVRPASEQYLGNSKIINLEKSRQRTLLLAGEKSPLLAACEKHLAAAGYNVVVATDGLEAKRYIRFSSPHLAVVDLQMPHMEGLAEVFRLKHLKETKCPIVIFAADKEAAGQAIPTEHLESADAFVCKNTPDALTALADACQKLLGHQQPISHPPSM